MQVKFQAASNPQFFNTLRNRVEDYFKQNNISKNGDWRMVSKTIIILSVFFGSYILLVSNLLAPWSAALICVLLGLFTAFIGFNISHDAVHGSYSSNPKVNKILGYTFDMLGASSYMWNLAHNIVHHTFTNIPEHDDDLEPVSLIRLHPEKKLKPIHRYQHYYATFFYGLTSISWVFMKDYKKLFKTKILNYEYKKVPTADVIKIVGAKLLYYFFFLVLPVLITDFAWWQVIIGFFIMHFAEGITLAIVFQLAHVVESTEFPTPSEDGTIENNWAIHQLHTTADFARNSKLATFFFGGLNFQVEHHLFPRICHVHYRKISDIVRQTALEFGIPYNDNKTMWDAIKSHYRVLKQFGRPELQVVR